MTGIGSERRNDTRLRMRRGKHEHQKIRSSIVEVRDLEASALLLKRAALPEH